MTDVSRRDRIVGVLVGVACGDALGRPVEGLSSAEVAGQYGRVTEMYADGTNDAGAGTVTAHARGALAVARSLAADRPVDDPSGDGDRLAAAAPCGVLAEPSDRTPATASVVGDAAGSGVADSATAVADLIAALLGGADPEAATDRALSLASDRGGDRRVRTALAVALDPVERGVGGPVETLEVAAHDALTARDTEDALTTAVSRGGPTTRLGAVTGGLAGARFGDRFPPRWLDVLTVGDEARALGRELA